MFHVNIYEGGTYGTLSLNCIAFLLFINIDDIDSHTLQWQSIHDFFKAIMYTCSYLCAKVTWPVVIVCLSEFENTSFCFFGFFFCLFVCFVCLFFVFVFVFVFFVFLFF